MSADSERAVKAATKHVSQLFLRCTARQRELVVVEILRLETGERPAPNDPEVRRMIRSLAREAQEELAGETIEVPQDVLQ